jgi:YidC/Oxa1 family membrane protein insertase
MNFISHAFNLVIYTPLFNALIWVYDVLPWKSMGLAIILFTILIRLALYPLSRKSIESQSALQKMQPAMNEIREKFKDDKQKQSAEIMKLYSDNKISPLSSCLPLLLQLPILWALNYIFRNAFSGNGFDVLYPFVHKPEFIQGVFLGFIHLADPKNIPLAILAGAAQFVQSWMLLQKTKKPKDKDSKEPEKPKTQEEKLADTTASMSRNMTYFFPLITVWFGYSLPAGLSLYWLITTLFAIVQQWIIQRKVDKVAAAETSVVS